MAEYQYGIPRLSMEGLPESRSDDRIQQIEREPTNSFRYTPLDNENSIRLLTIQPAESNSDPLVCTISPAEFRERPAYEALSYTWGSNLGSHAITLNGSPFFMDQNLFEALRYLRSQRQKKALSADAICIYQNDIPERNW
ncbi:hypothetical protein PG994_000920 [Apiospora phragmitis]|uniref:Heterokaryon incompatibility domain-containing protein n=1 Tax=Apiospora phragmitis TaxID=2905665 RepID=A0ABR1WQY6_9PEZI